MHEEREEVTLGLVGGVTEGSGPLNNNKVLQKNRISDKQSEVFLRVRLLLRFRARLWMTSIRLWQLQQPLCGLSAGILFFVTVALKRQCVFVPPLNCNFIILVIQDHNNSSLSQCCSLISKGHEDMLADTNHTLTCVINPTQMDCWS